MNKIKYHKKRDIKNFMKRGWFIKICIERGLWLKFKKFQSQLRWLVNNNGINNINFQTVLFVQHSLKKHNFKTYISITYYCVWAYALYQSPSFLRIDYIWKFLCTGRFTHNSPWIFFSNSRKDEANHAQYVPQVRDAKSSPCALWSRWHCDGKI